MGQSKLGYLYKLEPLLKKLNPPTKISIWFNFVNDEH